MKIGIFTILLALGGGLIKVFVAWKTPREAFLKELESEKREKELRSS